MSLFINKIVSSVLEIILISLVPFIWWLVTARKKAKFFQWLGFQKIDSSKKKTVLITSLLVEVAYMVLSFYLLYMVKDVENLATSEFSGLGIGALPAILVYALFNTALPEEILFRGFILKRISNRFGFNAANYVQCILFGFLHGAMFIKYVGPVVGVLITCLTMAIAWCMGYVNEKKADGSVLPSWGIHAVANIFSGMVAAFALI